MQTVAGDQEVNVKYIFPCVLMALDVSAAIVYLCGADWKRCIYWFAAATLTATVTF